MIVALTSTPVDLRPVVARAIASPADLELQSNGDDRSGGAMVERQGELVAVAAQRQVPVSWRARVPPLVKPTAAHWAQLPLDCDREISSNLSSST